MVGGASPQFARHHIEHDLAVVVVAIQAQWCADARVAIAVDLLTAQVHAVRAGPVPATGVAALRHPPGS
jgi:hypothetical protein